MTDFGKQLITIGLQKADYIYNDEVAVGEAIVHEPSLHVPAAAIARFFLQLPFKSLAVIDEPTNGLDPVADRLMNRLILKRCVGKTTMMVSHRLHIAPLVTQVALMSNGRLEHVGPHELLSKTSPKYNEIYRTSIEAESA